MSRVQILLAAAALALAPAAVSGQGDPPPPPWLFPDFVRGAVSTDSTPKRLPNSEASFTVAQVRNLFNVPDWRPKGHPPMPDLVAHGKQPDVRPCAYCHYPTGMGRPENGPLAGLPADYIVEQMVDYSSDARKSVVGQGGRWQMNAYAKALTKEDMKAAADYFSHLTYRPWVKVVESDTAPAVRFEAGLPLPVADKPAEPIAGRIIELPVNPEATELRDPDSPFIAYVPKGSIAKGKAVAETAACAACHGPDLKGQAPAPPIAGRSPTYVARALYDFKGGGRNGPGAQLMKPTAAGLTLSDMVAVAAYVGSLNP
jgi:cytochrome c553